MSNESLQIFGYGHTRLVSTKTYRELVEYIVSVRDSWIVTHWGKNKEDGLYRCTMEYINE